MIRKSKAPSKLITYLRGHKRAVAEGFVMPWKQPVKSLLTILTLAICFYIPLFLWTLWLNYDELKGSWQEQGTIAIFIDGHVDLKQAGIFLQEIKEKQIIESARLIDSDDLKAELNKDKQLSQVIDLLTSQDLPKQILVKVRSETNLQMIELFVNNLSINPQVEYVSYDKQWITQLQALTDTLLQIARISALMFILIVMVILGNAIGNEITDHKNELRLLELIGASWAQVRRSFLYMGTFLGIYAGLIAVLFLSLSFWWLKDAIQLLVQNFGINITLHGLSFFQVSMVISITIVVTWVAARLALSTQRLNQIL